MQATALVTEIVDVEVLVREWRERYDPTAIHGMPAHITAMNPFRAEVSDETASEIRAIAASFAPISVRFDRLDEFPVSVWLNPTPDTEFRALTAALASAFPDYPPYRGEFPEPQPHLTIGKADSDEDRHALRAQLDEAITPHLPLSTVATALSLFERDAHAQWHRTRSFPFLG